MNDRAADLVILSLVHGQALCVACLVAGGALITLGVVLDRRWRRP